MVRLMLTSIVATAALAGAPRAASAGSCEGYEREEVERFEAYARKPGPPLIGEALCLEPIIGTKLATRVVKACDVILAREPGLRACVEWGIVFGAQTLGGRPLFDALDAAVPLDVLGEGRRALELHRRLGDPRSAALVRAAWQAALGDPRLAKKKHAYVWAVWRRGAVDLFAALGGAPERAFLQDQLAATKARGLARAMRRSIAAIDARLAATP
jgi:hypothetical protein